MIGRYALASFCALLIVLVLFVAGKMLPTTVSFAAVDSIKQLTAEGVAVLRAMRVHPQYPIVLIGAFAAAILALLYNWVLELVRRSLAKQSLLRLFIFDLASMIPDVDRNARVTFSGTSFHVRGVDGVTFASEAKILMFEGYNVKLYETEGFKLAALLSANPRRCFWKTYKLMRDGEEVRTTLLTLQPDDPDLANFQTLYVGLQKKLYPQLNDLQVALVGERFWFIRPFAPMS